MSDAWQQFIDAFGRIGMAHWLSISKNMPPRWAAIAMGDREPGPVTADEALFYSRVSEKSVTRPRPRKPPTGPRAFSRDERRVIADALRRAISDTRTTLQAWQTNIPNVLGDDKRAAHNRSWLEALIAVQQQLAADVADNSFELRLERR